MTCVLPASFNFHPHKNTPNHQQPFRTQTQDKRITKTHTHTSQSSLLYVYTCSHSSICASIWGGGEGRRGKKSGETILGPQHTDLFRSLYYFDAAVCEKDKSCRFYMPPPLPKKNKLCFHIHASLLCVYIQFSSFFFVCVSKEERKKTGLMSSLLASYIYM